MSIVARPGQRLIGTAEAAKEYGCTTTQIRTLARLGHLTEFRQSERAIMYDLEEVRRIAKENRDKRRKRGGRPPRGSSAA